MARQALISGVSAETVTILRQAPDVDTWNIEHKIVNKTLLQLAVKQVEKKRSLHTAPMSSYYLSVHVTYGPYMRSKRRPTRGYWTIHALPVCSGETALACRLRVWCYRDFIASIHATARGIACV